MTGGGGFTESDALSTGTEPLDHFVADFNGDGQKDIAVLDDTDDTLSVMLGNGDGTFQNPASYSASTTGEGTFGDFNGDGHLDIVTSNGSDELYVILNNGDGSFQPLILSDFGSGTNGAKFAVSDFNGDGFLDLAATKAKVQHVHTLLGNGDGTFELGYQVNISEPTALTVADLNNDGVEDIVTIGGADLTSFLSSTQDGVAPLVDFSLSTIADARQTLSMLGHRLEGLSLQRAEIGAHLSRIDVASGVLSISKENFLAASSLIRDADIADESSKLVRLQILQQASTAVLAQANQSPQLVLTLLQ